MKNKWLKPAAIVCAFFFVTFVVSFLNNLHFPVDVIAGEDSVGTWVSGVLLILCAGISLVIGMQSKPFPSLITASFFFLLAIDERFMIHERLKIELTFRFFKDAESPVWIAELPVIVGACIGLFMTWLLWHCLEKSRSFLVAATVLGVASVIFDIFHWGVFWEECFKLLGELSIVLGLLKKYED